MKNRKILSLVALFATLLLVAALLSSCGASSADGYAGEDVGGTKNDQFSNESETPSAPGLSTNTTVTPLPNMDGKQGTKVIKTFHLSAETTEFDNAIAALHTLIAEHGGYVEKSSTNNQSLSGHSQSYRRYASYTLRIPAENAETFVASIGSTLHLTANESTVQDVSETYYSIEARLQELRVERDSLLEILESPEVTKDYQMWLTVKQRLSEVTQQIAVYQGQLNNYDSKVAYSTVNLNVSEVLVYSAVSENNSFGARLSAAFSDGWNGFVEGAQEFAILLAEGLPVLVLIAILVTLPLVITFTVLKKQKKKQEMTTQTKKDQ